MYYVWRMDHAAQYYHSTEKLTGDVPFPSFNVSPVSLWYSRGIPLEPPIQFGLFSGYNTRTENTFAHYLRCHLSFFQHSFGHNVIKFWNSLPPDIRDHLHFSDYKNELKTFLLTDLQSACVFYFGIRVIVIVYM